MQLHSNAATCPRQRTLIQNSALPYRTLATQLDISISSVHHWKHATSVQDKSCRPHTIRYALDEQESELALWMRRSGELPLDDLHEALEVLLPHLTRASLHRLLVRHGCSRLPKKEQQPSGEPGVFKEYGPGYIHIDCFYLPQLEGQKYYCFVAIDRATRLVYLYVYENKNKECATDFLERCLGFFPFQIEKILTDNGREFTLAGFKNRWGTQTKSVHPFEAKCEEQGIEHRKTRPYTPKTNGMVERANGLTKENTTKRHRYTSAQQMKDDLARWRSFYNFHRRNRRIGRKTPYEMVCWWFEKQPGLFLKQPSHLLQYCSQPAET
jgi:transposase InsO family protein